MADVHLVVGVSVMVLAVITGVWGTVAWFANRPSVWFWYVLRAMQFALVAQVLLGGLLLATGPDAVKGEHYMYGVVALVVSFFAEWMRGAAASRELPEEVEFETLAKPEQRDIAIRIVRRETLTMTIAAWLIVILVFRAAQTSGHLF